MLPVPNLVHIFIQTVLQLELEKGFNKVVNLYSREIFI